MTARDIVHIVLAIVGMAALLVGLIENLKRRGDRDDD